MGLYFMGMMILIIIIMKSMDNSPKLVKGLFYIFYGTDNTNSDMSYHNHMDRLQSTTQTNID